MSQVSSLIAVGCAPVLTKVFQGGLVQAGAASQASQVALNPPIAGLGTTAQAALDKLKPQEFAQTTPATEWIWNHNLGFRPTPKVYNLAYQEIDALIEHPSVNQIKVQVNPASPGYIVI